MIKCNKKYLLDIPGHLDMESDDLFEVLTEYHNTSTATLYQNYGDSVEIMNTKKEFSSKYNIHSLEDLAEYINLNFTETDFQRASNNKEMYGIRVRQEYFSSNYGDVGYLFLLVDLRNELPIIHVRAWQNDKLPLESLIELNDFY